MTPIWSPGGQTIAFLSNRAPDGSDCISKNGPVNIWAMNADGSNLHPLTKLTASFSGAGNSAANDVVWLPDGSKPAYDSFQALDGSDSIAPFQIANVLGHKCRRHRVRPSDKTYSPSGGLNQASLVPRFLAIAKSENRSLSNFIEKVLKNEVAKHEAKGGRIKTE